MQEYNALGNIQFGDGYVLFSINPDIYDLDVVRKAALDFFDRACVILDGNPRTEILVELRPKGSFMLKDMVEDFNKLLLENANRKN